MLQCVPSPCQSRHLTFTVAYLTYSLINEYVKHVPTDELSRVFSALADPTRRDILVRLGRGSATVTELAQPFPISLPAVSRHLKVLEQAGLIDRDRAPVALQFAARRADPGGDGVDGAPDRGLDRPLRPAG